MFLAVWIVVLGGLLATVGAGTMLYWLGPLLLEAAGAILEAVCDVIGSIGD